jgi:hypothetical protein
MATVMLVTKAKQVPDGRTQRCAVRQSVTETPTDARAMLPS